MTRENAAQGLSASQFIDGLPKTTDPGPPGHVWREIGRVDANVAFQGGVTALQRCVTYCWRTWISNLRRRDLEYWLIAAGERYDPDRMVVSLGQWEPEEEAGI